MIELRWLARMVDRPRGIDDGIYNPPLPDKLETRVLQYRYPVHPDSVGLGPDCYSNGMAWCNWQDVPTVPAAADEGGGK